MMYQDSQKSCGRSLVSHRLQIRNKTAQPEIPTPKSNFQIEDRQTSSANCSFLPVGTTCNVYITHVEDGPYSFSVQLKSHSEEIQPKIDAMCIRNPPRPNSEPLLPGSNILGRTRTEGKFRRAVVMNVKATSCKVYFMDYGTTDELPQSEIYALPSIIRDMAHPQAMGFCLADLRTPTLPETCKDIFAKLVLNKQVLLRVTENEHGSLTQCCEMFLDGKNVREILLNIVLPLEYTTQFPSGSREIAVNVSFVDCPTEFFVQYHSEIEILGAIQDSLAAYCPAQERIQSVSQLDIGSPVASLYTVDNNWYRALVIGIDEKTVNVLYVDYGNRDQVNVSQLCNLNRQLVTKWRRQAVECCLVGFENSRPDTLLGEEMENKVLGGHFTLRLKYLLGGVRLVVDLIDENGKSVAHMLNEIAKTNSQDVYQFSQQSSKCPPGFGAHSAGYSDMDHNRGGDGGGDSRDRFGGSNTGRNSAADTRSYQRQYNKHSEHDDRYMDDDRGAGADRYKKKWEDKNSSKWRDEGNNWRDEIRRNDDTAERGNRFNRNDSWEGSKVKDRLDRSARAGGDRSSGGANRGDRGAAGRFSDGKRPRSRERYSGDHDRESNNRYNSRDDEEKISDHGSSSDRYERGNERFGSGRFSGDKSGRAEKGGNRKYSGDYDNKFNDRKFNDRGDKGSGGGRFGEGGRFGDKPNRSRDQGDPKSGRRNNDKRSFDSNYSSKGREAQNVPAMAASDGDVWDDEDGTGKEQPVSQSAQVAQQVREYLPMNIVAGDTYSVYFSTMGNKPNEVNVQLDGSLTDLEELRYLIDAEESIITQNNRSISKELLTPGLPVLARFSEDHLLYRAIIRTHVSGKVTVLFVDYGNSDEVELSDLYTVTSELAMKPIQALRVMLTDIKPIADQWPSDHSAYAAYYVTDDALTLKVNMLKSIDGEIVCFGSLTKSDGATVSQKLIEDNLALAANESATASTILSDNQLTTTEHSTPMTSENWMTKLDLLVGQQLYAVIFNKISNTSFTLRLCCADLLAECQVDDDCPISSISLNDKVIISGTGVLNNRLLVKIYDCNGKQLSDSKTGNNFVSPICPMPIIKTNDLVFVSHFNGEVVFVQSSSSTKDISVLLDKLFLHYNDSKPDSDAKWEVGALCCVLAEDGNWYRSKIISTDRDKYNVMFIDYGNGETVNSQNLRQMDSSFYSHELCLGIHLEVEWTKPNPTLMELVENEEFQCEFSKNYDKLWVGNLTFVSSGENLVKKLTSENIAKEKKLKKVNFISQKDSIKVGASLPVLVSHVDTPTMFWVQLCANINIIEDLQQKLKDCIENMPAPNDNCNVFAAKYSKDNVWYRAVDNGDGDMVRYIDYGNTEPASLRKQLPEDLLNPLEGCAIPMYLRVKPNSGNWSKESTELVEAFIDQQITAEIISNDEKIIVDLKCDDKYLSKLLVDGNHGSYIEKTTETKGHEIIIVSILDVNRFYVQFVSDSDSQIEMMYYLSRAYKFDEVDCFDVGDIVAGKNTLDGQWYRAKIISANPLHTLLIDYGNITSVSDIRFLPEHLQIMHPMAIPCSLDIPKDKIYTERFAIIANNPTRVFNLIFKTKGKDLNIVQLQDEDGTDVTELLYSTEFDSMIAEGDGNLYTVGNRLSNCIVCHANGPYDFYIQTPTSQGLVQNISELLAEAALFPKVDKLEKGDIIAVLSSEDDLWYRCKIINTEPEIEGHFVDYGNGTLVTEYRSLPDEIKAIPELAIKCSLQLPEGIGGWSAEAVLTFTEFVNNNNNGFDVITLSEGDPLIVELEASGKLKTKITEELLKLCTPATPVPSKPATRTTSPVVCSSELVTGDFITVESIKSPVVSTETLEEVCSDLIVEPSFSKTDTPNKCCITHVNSHNDFFIRDSNTIADLDQITLMLSELEIDSKEEPHSIEELVIAQVEGEFFRAKIIEINPLKVSLIDIGNVTETSNLFNIPVTIKNIPPKAKNCKLYVPQDQLTMIEKNMDEFISVTLSDNEEFIYRVISENNDKPEIELSLNGVNIIDVIKNNLNKKLKSSPLISDNDVRNDTKVMCEEPSLLQGSCLKVTIPFVKSLTDFYIKEITCDSERFKEMMVADKLEIPTAVKVGDLVAAYSLEDNLWHRAKIIRLDPKEVLFIDLGNTSLVNEIRTLPEELTALPSKCYPAELFRPENVAEWTAEVEKEFLSFCQKTSEFNCIIISSVVGKPFIVNLSTPELGDLSCALIKKVENTENSTMETGTISSDSDAHTELVNNETDLIENVDDNSTAKIGTITPDLLPTLESDVELLNKESDIKIEKETQTAKTPLRVKTVAEIKANAKPRIVTRSTSVPLKSGRGTPSPVPRTKSTVNKKDEPQPTMRRSISLEDKIIPGCVSGHVDN